VIRELEGGQTNHSFLVGPGALRAVVRINRLHAVKLGIDRQRELSILNVLQPSGLVPKILYADKDVLVSEFIEGPVLTADHLADKSIQEALYKAIEKVQSLRLPNADARSYRSYCQQYCDQIPKHLLSDGVKTDIYNIAEQVDGGDWQPVICHHDLVLENIIVNNRGLFIIDWEYAALGHPDIDLVRVFGNGAVGIGGSESERRALLTMQYLLDKLWSAIQYPQLQSVLQDNLSKIIATEMPK